MTRLTGWLLVTSSLLPAALADDLSEARSLIQQNQFLRAEAELRGFLAKAENSADGHFLLGYVLFKEQKAKESLAEYTEGARYRSPTAADLAVVGGDYVLLKDYLDADKWFTKSVEWNPTDFQTLYYLGRTKYSENRFDEAIDIFARCLKLQARSVKAEDNLGLSFQGLNRIEDAAAAFETAISWDEHDQVKDPTPYVDLGALLIDSGRPSEALPYLHKALRLASQDMRAHRELGKAYLHLNDLGSSQAELEASAALAPEDAPVHFMLAQVYRKRGLNEKAQQETIIYKRLTAAHSTEPPAK